MKAPDKIYVRDFGNSLCKVWTYTKGNKKNDVDLVYIRKDAILEWAKDMIECGATLLATDTLIDKLNSM